MLKCGVGQAWIARKRAGESMYSIVQTPNLRLKVILRETELSSVLADPLRISSEDLASSKASVNEGLIPISGKDPHPRRSRGGELVAEYSTAEDTITLSGNLHRRLPIYVVLKSHTKTYKNFLRLIVRELVQSQATTDHQSEEMEGLTRLQEYFQRKLTENSSGEEISAGSETSIDVIENTEFIDIFGEDFESGYGDVSNLSRQDSHQDDPAEAITSSSSFLSQAVAQSHRRFRLFDRTRVEPVFISGFFSLEVQEVADAGLIQEEGGLAPVFEDLEKSLQILSQLAVVRQSGRLRAEVNLRLGQEILPETEFFLHWGRTDSSSSIWVDEEIIPGEITKNPDDTLTIRKALDLEADGHYAMTLFARLAGDPRKIWANSFGFPDTRFYVSPKDLFPRQTEAIADSRIHLRRKLERSGIIMQGLANYQSFLSTINSFARSGKTALLQQEIWEVSKNLPEFRELICEYYEILGEELQHPLNGLSRKTRKLAQLVLGNLGLGGVIMVAPEGPHAIAGGMAQAVVGMMNGLAQTGVPVTLITPLYEKSQGSKHKSAEDMLRDGVTLGDKQVPIEYRGQISIPFGPLYSEKTGEISRAPQRMATGVYSASSGSVNVVFLRHRRLADKLYPSVWSDELLRRCAFLARGSLEVIRKNLIDIPGNVLVTNDWTTGLIHLLLKADETYQNCEQLKSLRTFHIIHNGGRAYQGKMLSQQFGETLWPLLGLGSEHIPSVEDPIEQGALNLSKAAVFHVADGLLAVSRHYAEQLLYTSGGEGLEGCYRMKKDILFGISNGIDSYALRKVFWSVGEQARIELGIPALVSKFSERRLLNQLQSYKQISKVYLQRKYGLVENSNAIFMCFIGRLAEQKGIQLFSKPVDGKSSLQVLLESDPNVQIFIGGPPSLGDITVEELIVLLALLKRRFPGRVASVLDFIPHREALHVTLASDLFLMPSRFEPGGITQLEALAAGTPVIARNVGGIAATLENFDARTKTGNAFLFQDYSAIAFCDAALIALDYLSDPEHRQELSRQAAQAQHDWADRVPKYTALFQNSLGALCPRDGYRYLSTKRSLVDSARPRFGAGTS